MPLTGEYAPSPFEWSRVNAELYMASGGTEGTENQGKPVVLLTTVGARTGKLRKTPLMRVEHAGQYAVVASLAGAPKNPVWYYNAIKNPRVELQDGTTSCDDYDAREVFGDEKAIWWERATAVWPDYDEYQKHTDRQIPVLVLTPVPGERKALEALANTFSRAYPDADLATLRSIFHSDAVVWHNWDRSDQRIEDNLAALQAVSASLRSMAYKNIRRQYLSHGWVQQHTVTGETQTGQIWEAEACLVVTVADSRIQRLDEYIDPAQYAAH
jgi:F420H(2)-dependent quinone reductase